METGNLTPKSNNDILKMRFTGSFWQPDGFGSMLNIVVNKHGNLTLGITTKDQDKETSWNVILDSAQRIALGNAIVQYEPVLYEEYK